MALIDGLALLGFAKGVKTDAAATDAAVIDIPHDRCHVLGVVAYNASGNNALATLGVFTAASGGGTGVVADAALTTHTTAAVNSARTVADPAVNADKLYVRVGTASGVAGSTIDVAVYGIALP